MNSNVNACKLSGKRIPDMFLKNALSNYPDSVGAAYCEKGKKIVLIRLPDGNTDLDLINIAQDDCKDNAVLFSFGKGKIAGELDCQPYTLLEDKDKNPLAVCICEGDFSNNSSAGASYSDEYFAVNKVIVPKLQAVYDAMGEDLAATIKGFNTDKTRTALKGLFIGDGSITILFANGAMLTYERTEKKKAFDWGWVSDPLGYTEAAAAKPAEKSFGLANLAKKATDAVVNAVSSKSTAEPAAPAPKPAPAVDDDDEPHLPGQEPIKKEEIKKSIASVEPIKQPEKVALSNQSVLIKKVELTSEEEYFQPDKKFMEVGMRSQLKREYRTHAGFLPNNWEDGPRVKKADKKLKALLNNKKQQAKANGLAALKEITTDTAITASTKHAVDDGPVHLPQEDEPHIPHKDVDTKHIPDSVGLLSAASKKQLQDFVKEGHVVKAIDKHSKIVIDPAKLQELEKRKPSFSECGIQFEETIMWPPEIFLELLKTNPEAGERWIAEAVRLYVRPALTARKEAAERRAQEEPVSQPKKVANAGGRAFDPENL